MYIPGPKPIPICQKKILTLKEAAAYFNIGIIALRRLGKIPKNKFAIFKGTELLIKRQELKDYLNRQKNI